MSQYRVAIVGATGAVGTEMVSVLEGRNFPVSELIPLASERSVGKTVQFRGESIPVQLLSKNSFRGVDIGLFSAGAGRSLEFAPAANDAGCVVIDNSSAFRMVPDVPLVVPEVNAHVLGTHKGVVANPNCAAIILCMAVAPLRRLAGIRRLVVSTYQSTSGAGAMAMQELLDQTAGYLAGNEPPPAVFRWPIAFNLFSHNTKISPNGYNDEENKVMMETRKILEMPHLRMTATCIRVSTLRAHCESVNVEFDQVVGEEDIRAAIRDFPGVVLQDDRTENHFPMPREAAFRDDVFVGRIRRDLGLPEAIDMFVSGDQLRKGAALNAVQIAERLFLHK